LSAAAAATVLEWLSALEQTELAASLRSSVVAYPLVNAGHILGVALLVGASVPLDLRLLGLWRSAALAPLWRVLGVTAAVGLVVAVLFGALLFATRASEYAQSALFRAKMVLLALGIANALAVRRIARMQALTEGAGSVRPALAVRLGAGVSLIVWLAVLTLGRLVGYF
jgi:hypothetical protein